MKQIRPGQLVRSDKLPIICPRCEKDQPIGDIGVAGMNPIYTELLGAAFRCKRCRKPFAPLLVEEPAARATPTASQ